MSAARYALYLAPGPETALWRFGSGVLGYDAESGAELAQPALPGFGADELHKLTDDPRRYGFHLTLKAPFRLAEGQDEPALITALAAFAAARPVFDVGALSLKCRGGSPGRGFVCLVPATQCEPLHALETAAVSAFEPFRAPLNAAELARRRPDLLPPRERAYLERFGYPYIFEAFRPHFSLSGAMAAPERLAGALAAWLAAGVGEPHFRCDSLALFRQANPESRFRVLARLPLG